MAKLSASLAALVWLIPLKVLASPAPSPVRAFDGNEVGEAMTYIGQPMFKIAALAVAIIAIRRWIK